MALSHSDDTTPGPGGSPAAGEGHNPMLIRTREPERNKWIIPMLAGAVLIIGAAAWGYVATHPAPPIVNHAVAASETPPGGT